MDRDKLTKTMADFIQSIGLTIRFTEVPENTFLPGILVDKGHIFVDKAKIKYPAYLLHEA